MGLIDVLAANTLRVAKALPGVPAAERDNIAGRAFAKISRELLGPFLFKVVKASAIEFYEDRGSTLMEDVRETLTRRIIGIAGVLAADVADAEPIAAKAVEKLTELFDGPYLRAVVLNEAADTLRSTKENTVTPMEGESVEDALEAVIFQYANRPIQRDFPPSYVFEARLKLIFGSDAMPDHEALVYGFNVHLGRQPTAIVAELATIPIAALIDTLIGQYVEQSNISQARCADLFRGLMLLRGSPSASKKLPEYWDPLLRVAAWVEDVAEAAQKGGDDEIRQFKAAEGKPPHRRLSYLCSSYLGHAPHKLVAEHGPLTLEQLGVKFVTHYASENGCTAMQIRARFSPLINIPDKVAENVFSSYFTPHRTVSDWIFNVRRRSKQAELTEAGVGVALICSAPGCKPWEIMTFLLTHCLGWRVSQVASTFGAHLLNQMCAEIEQLFAEYWEADAEVVHGWFAALRRACLVNLCGEVCLRQCSDQWEYGSAHVLSDWRSKVLQVVLSLFERSDAVLFAFQHNLLRQSSVQSIKAGV